MMDNPAFLTFRHAIDAIVTSPASWAIFVLAHGAALLWAIKRHDLRPALLINIVLGAVLFSYNANVLAGTYGYDDFQMVPVVAGLINFICGVAALAGVRVPRAIIWIGFGFVFIATVLFTIFAYMLSFERLI